MGDFTKSGNLVHYVDCILLPGRGLFGEWDFEGILSTLPAVGSCIVGLLIGQFLFAAENYSRSERSVALLIGGIFAVSLGGIWDLSFPINKTLWTSSFVLFDAGSFPFF